MSLKNFLAFMKVGFKTALRFRFNFVIGMLVTPLSVIIYYFLWKSVYSSTGQTIIKGFTFNELVSYYVVSMIVGLFIWIDIDKWMADDIRKGQLVVDLLKPMNYIWQCLFFEIGLNMLGIIIQIIPVFAAGLIFFGLKITSGWFFTAFFISMFLGFLIAYFLSFLVGITAFWFKEISGLRRVRRALMMFLSGGLIPLVFFPITLQKIFHFLPFEYMRYVPINIFLGKYSLTETLFQLFLQLIWVFILFAIISFCWNIAIKKFSGEGT